MNCKYVLNTVLQCSHTLQHCIKGDVFYMQVKSKVPWLTGVLKLLQEIQELAQDLIDKVVQ